MYNPTEGVRDLLVTAGVGVFASTSAWGIYIGLSPDSPDACITIYNAPGGQPNPKWLLDYPGVQVVVRGNENGYQAAFSKAVDIKNALLGLPSQDLGGDRWVAVLMQGDITPMGFEPKKQRPMFSLNFKLIIEPADATGDHRDPL